MAVVGQFPAFTECAKIMVAEFKDRHGNILNDNSDTRGSYVATYNGISTHCRSSCAERDFHRKTVYITEKMIFVVDKLAAKDTEKK